MFNWFKYLISLTCLKNSERHFENDSKHDQKFDFDQTLSIREVDSPKKIQWDSKNRRIYWLNQDGKIFSSLENGDNLTELDLDGDYARGFDIYSVGKKSTGQMQKRIKYI